MLNDAINKLFSISEAHNLKLYYVGGCVRDELLNHKVYDYDFCINTSPEYLLEIFNPYIVSNNVNIKGSIKVEINKYTFEITCLRKESGVIKERYPQKISFNVDLKTDSFRRDFTINALYKDYYGNLYDYHDGLTDLKNKVIKFIGNPIIRIKEDPIRIMRGLRFAHTLDFKIEHNSLMAMNELKELVRGLKVIKFEEMKHLLNDYKAIDYIIKNINFYQAFFPEVPISFYQNLKEHYNEDYFYNFLTYFDHFVYSLLSLTKEEVKKINLLASLNSNEYKLKDLMKQDYNLKQLIKNSLIKDCDNVLKQYDEIITKGYIVNKSDLKTKFNDLLKIVNDQTQAIEIYDKLYQIMYDNDTLNEDEVLNDLLNNKKWL